MPKFDGYKCCICGELQDDIWGHNPEPVKSEGRCCSYCNIEVVLLATLEMLSKMANNTKECSNDDCDTAVDNKEDDICTDCYMKEIDKEIYKYN